MQNTIMVIILSLGLSMTAMAGEPPYTGLLKGKLTGKAAEEEVKNFAHEYEQHLLEDKWVRPLYERYIDTIGVQNIALVLETFDESCHGVAHSLGRIIAARVDDLGAGMNICGSTCTYACLHGLFGVYFNELGKEYQDGHEHHGQHHTHDTHESNRQTRVIFTDTELQQFSRDANTACKKSESIVDGFFSGNCAHGIGHALGKLGGNIESANAYCKIFPDPDMQYYCETGVFMELGGKIENTLFADTEARSEEIRIALDYCREESQYPSACLRFLLPRNKSLGHIMRYAHICSGESGLMRAHCFNALGFHSRTYVAHNPTEMTYACSIGTAQDQKACISGITLMKKGQQYRDDIKVACGYLENESQKNFCSHQVSQYYYDVENEYFSGLMVSSH